MARKRMFSLDVVDSDLFLDMPKTSQLLYYNLGMRADDDGFIGNPKRLLRMLGADEDDLKLLVAKGFVILFESGIIVITHWKQNNYIAKDRRKETIHKTEKRLLNIDENGVYFLKQSECKQDVYGSVYNLDTQYSIDKSSIDKYSSCCSNSNIYNNNIYIPKKEHIKNYINNNNYTFDPEYFYNYYSSRNWYIGNTPIENFDQLKSIMDNWQIKERETKKLEAPNGSFNNYNQKIYSNEELEEIVRNKQKNNSF